jgi:hypothetical protein
MSTQLVANSKKELSARWQRAKVTYPAVALSAHQALRALEFEERAERALTSIRLTDTFAAYTLCDVLADLSRALEAWVYIGARLWHLCETGQADAEIQALHKNSTEQYLRLLTYHLQVQQQTFAFCQEHQIILRFGVVTQAFDVSRQIQGGNTETSVFLQEEVAR